MENEKLINNRIKNNREIKNFLENKQPKKSTNSLVTTAWKGLTDITLLNKVISDALSEVKKNYQNKTFNKKKFENKIAHVDYALKSGRKIFNEKNLDGLLLLLGSLLEYKGYQTKILEGLKIHIGINTKEEFKDAIKQILKDRFPQDNVAFWEKMSRLPHVILTLLFSDDAQKKKFVKILCNGFEFEQDLLDENSALNEMLKLDKRIDTTESLTKMGL